jgi:hypothetical protein
VTQINNTNTGGLTDGNGLSIGGEGISLAFPLDPTSAFGVGAITNISSINGIAFPPPVEATRQATYYKSAAQLLTSGNTDITFDLSGAWNYTGGYITHTDGSADFTVVEPGLYQLEFNATVAADGATWPTTTNKIIAIDITRSPTAEQAVIASSSVMASAINYAQCVSASFYLEAGDVINLRLSGTYATATPSALGITNTIDLGTFFTWRFIS